MFNIRNSPSGGEWELLLGGVFDHLNFFQSLKQHFVNMEHWLKSKLVWPICTKKFEVKKNDTGAMTAAKNEEFLLGYNMKSVI